jgi:hypothetical protein
MVVQDATISDAKTTALFGLDELSPVDRAKSKKDITEIAYMYLIVRY